MKNIVNLSNTNNQLFLKFIGHSTQQQQNAHIQRAIWSFTKKYHILDHKTNLYKEFN